MQSEGLPIKIDTKETPIRLKSSGINRTLFGDYIEIGRDEAKPDELKVIPADKKVTWEELSKLPSLLEEKTRGKKTYKGLSAAGKKKVSEIIHQEVRFDDEDVMDRDSATVLIEKMKSQVKGIKRAEWTDMHRFYFSASKSLEAQIRKADEITARAMMEVSNSPWRDTAGLLKNKLISFGATEKQSERALSVAGRRMIAEVSKLTDDSFERDFMLHQLAYDLKRSKTVNQNQAEKLERRQKEVTDRLKEVIGQALVGPEDPKASPITKIAPSVNRVFDTSLKTGVLRTRLEIEAPDILLKGGLADQPDWEQMGGFNKIIPDDQKEAFIAEYVRRKNSPQNWSEAGGLDEDMIRTLKLRMLIEERLLKINNITSLREAIEDVAKESGDDRIDTVARLLEAKWLPETEKEKLRSEFKELKAEQGRRKQGRLGGFLGLAAKIEGKLKQAISRVKHEEIPSGSPGILEQLYNRFLLWKGDDERQRQFKIVLGNSMYLGSSIAVVASHLRNPDAPTIQNIIENPEFQFIGQPFETTEDSPYETHFVTDLLKEGSSKAHQVIDSAVHYVDEAADEIKELGLLAGNIAEAASRIAVEGAPLGIKALQAAPEAVETAVELVKSYLNPEPVAAMEFSLDSPSDIPVETSSSESDVNREVPVTPIPDAVQVAKAIQPEAPENPKTAENVLEFLMKDVLDYFKTETLERIEAMPDADEKLHKELLGGEEALKDRNYMHVVIFGKGTGEKFVHGKMFGNEGHADIILSAVLDDTGKLSIVSHDRYELAPELNGDPLNSITWYNQEELKEGKYILHSPEFKAQTMEEVSGIPVDMILEVDFDSFEAIVDVVFPNGIDVPIGEGEGFYNDLLHKEYKSNETYTMKGMELLEFVRSRFTTSMFARESRAGQVLGIMMNGVIQEYLMDTLDRIKANPADAVTVIEEKVSQINAILPEIERLESQDVRDLRVYGAMNDFGKTDRTFADFMRDYLEGLKKNLSDPKVLAHLIKLSPTAKSVASNLKNMERVSFSNAPDSEFPLENEGEKMVIPGKSDQVYDSTKARSYWEPMRNFIRSKVFGIKESAVVIP